MNDLFTFEEKQEILSKLGYTVKEVEEEAKYAAYHNDIEYVKYKIVGVFNGKEPFCKPSIGYGEIAKQEWVEQAFASELNAKLKKFIQTSIIWN